EPVEPGGLQRPGDANQDGRLDLSDPVFLLGHLFVEQRVLPCGGTLEGAGNRSLLDTNGDGNVDLSDPINALNFLFLGGDPPTLGVNCVRIVGCPTVCTRP
ncbi:MAG: hypothetical protein O7J95_10515, partial [Planctomycetota bacterium]|nr:hypothetical protein [Planctomycetota bacterium]